MTIKDWPEAERPREKLLQKGAASLSDSELLAIFLRTGVNGKSAVELARQLLTQFGSLSGLLDASQIQFCQQYGLGPAKFVQLQASLEMSRRHLGTKLKHTDVFTDVATTKRYLQQQLGFHQHEIFACLWLDTQHRLVCFEELFSGTIDSASVYPREVVKRALHHNAAAVILSHNHPSGSVNPSQSDIAITHKLTEALALIDVRVLDHLIVSEGESYSMTEAQQIVG